MHRERRWIGLDDITLNTFFSLLSIIIIKMQWNEWEVKQFVQQKKHFKFSYRARSEHSNMKRETMEISWNFLFFFWYINKFSRNYIISNQQPATCIHWWTSEQTKKKKKREDIYIQMDKCRYFYASNQIE